MFRTFRKPFAAVALCTALTSALAGPTMLYVGDDMTDLTFALDQAINAAIATQDSPVVLVVKDTQVSQAVQGSPLQATIKEGLANHVQMFVCEADLIRYGISPNKLIAGLTLIKAPALKSEATAPAEIQPLQRFKKQAEKVCDQ